MSAKTVFSILLPLALLILIEGCGKKAKWLPKLYPCRVQILQEGEPLAGADIQLFSDQAAISRFAIVGTTDETGTANILTQTYPGVPLGDYRVTVVKTEIEDIQVPPAQSRVVETITAENGETIEISEPTYIPPTAMPKQTSLIPPEWGDSESTPGRLKIEKRGKRLFTFDLGAAS